mmetsp:Transcript_10079/g.13137  ORF Transcript_10079/g.13137 Transcript_10079/m.13137 type:complete len:527 (-) Transcript_10079:169-1749(-)|eukprot:CAMPEP_0117751694 /NCGR_PEP_ID=MMETSP0947-20121206/11132_1 /TAXON_ID=44440 /ORGANISM="Chattonella subsalsa, Strain CCMP2191" /LENGTH=526 /DNA_ID=CAMNT_0005570133 /DNA_START=101 /DNA_END=1681 /DNA_ORIENTATION=-
MAVSLLRFVVLTLFLSKCIAQHVIEINGANELEATVSQFPFVVVKFYAPWCGHCKKMAPEYDLAALELHDIDPEIKLAKVNAEENPDLKQQFGIRGYPTVKMFRGNLDDHQDYKGSRESYNLVAQFKALKNGEAPPPKLDKKEGMKSMKNKRTAPDVSRRGGGQDTERRRENKDHREQRRELRDADAKRAQEKRRRKERDPQKEQLKNMDPDERRRLKNRMKQDNVSPQERREKDAIKRRAKEERERKADSKRDPRYASFRGNPRDHPEWDDSLEGLPPDQQKKELKDRELKKEKARAKMRELNLPDVQLRDLPDWDESMENLSFEQVKKRMKAKAQRRRKEEEIQYREDMTDDEKREWRKNKNERKRGRPSPPPDGRKAPRAPPDDHEPLLEPEGSKVQTVTKDNFEQLIRDNPLVLVQFFLPWDGQCKRVSSEFTEASKRLHEAFGDEVVLAKIDMNERETRKIGMRYKMQGVPEFKVFQGNPDEYIQYTDAFTEKAIAEFMGNMKQGLVDLKGRTMVAEDPEF